MTPDRLDGLDPRERAACLLAERILGARAETYDREGRQGVVDAMLRLSDGRSAAFEVTVLAAPGAMHMSSLLQREDYQWPSPGAWWWTVQVGNVADLPRLRAIYERIAGTCEMQGVARPEDLRWQLRDKDPDLQWLVEESRSSMSGHLNVPADVRGRIRQVMVVPDGRGGAVDSGLAGVADALRGVFAEPGMAKHLAKVARAGADEGHLFVPVHMSALPFAVLYGLSFGDELPPEPPPLPVGVTHLWLAAGLGQRVLLWTPPVGSSTPWSPRSSLCQLASTSAARATSSASCL